jgi:hypothetical protein
LSRNARTFTDLDEKDCYRMDSRMDETSEQFPLLRHIEALFDMNPETGWELEWELRGLAKSVHALGQLIAEYADTLRDEGVDARVTKLIDAMAEPLTGTAYQTGKQALATYRDLYRIQLESGHGDWVRQPQPEFFNPNNR